MGYFREGACTRWEGGQKWQKPTQESIGYGGEGINQEEGGQGEQQLTRMKRRTKVDSGMQDGARGGRKRGESGARERGMKGGEGERGEGGEGKRDRMFGWSEGEGGKGGGRGT